MKNVPREREDDCSFPTAFALMLGNTQVQTLPTTDINYHLLMIKHNLIIYVHSRFHIKPTVGLFL
jgi:hypothetical protein